VRQQLARFAQAHPAARVELQFTPDAADQRHQLYVQWLNAHAADPDVLQLDLIWTAEFGAAGAHRRDACRRVEQSAPPLDIYEQPANTFVAQFIGSPPMNLVPAPAPGVEAPAGTLVGVRPPDVALDGNGPLDGVVEMVEPRGHDSVVYVRLDCPRGPPARGAHHGAAAAGGHEAASGVP
jgi:hypothetical protein